MRGAVGGVLVVMALSGCRSMPASAPLPPDVVVQAQQRRAQALGLGAGDCLRPGWAMAGRMAVSNAEDAGSGRFEWVQGGGAFKLQLTAPVTQHTWILEADAQGAQLHGLPGGSQRGPEAEALLQQATGWVIPLRALGCWIRGVAANAQYWGEAQLVLDAQQLPQTLQQSGWQIRYSGWKVDPFSGMPMPARIEVQRDGSRVRLAVDRWGLE